MYDHYAYPIWRKFTKNLNKNLIYNTSDIAVVKNSSQLVQK